LAPQLSLAILSGGSKSAVFINAFCAAPQRHSVTEWVQVKDGGACFFNAKYDPESEQVYDVVVNGIA